MSILTKEYDKEYIPGRAGIPGTPGSPYRAGYWKEVVTGYYPTFYILFVYDKVEKITYWRGWGLPSSYSNNPARYEVFYAESVAPIYKSVWVPPSPYVAPTAGVPAVPSQTIIDNNMGWNAGAVGISNMVGDGEFRWHAEPDSVGITIGLSNPEEDVGHTARELTFAFNIEGRNYRIVEQGGIKTNFATVARDDAWYHIQRLGDTIRYMVDGTLIYTSLLTPTGNELTPDISMYVAEDTVYDPELITPITSSLSAVTNSKGFFAADNFWDTKTTSNVGITGVKAGNTFFTSFNTTTNTQSSFLLTRQAESSLSATTDSNFGTGVGGIGIKCENDLGVTWRTYAYDTSEIGYSDVSFLPLESYSEDPFLTPNWGIANTVLTPLMSVSISMTGHTTTSSSMTMEPVQKGLIADYDYAFSEIKLQAMDSLAFGPSDLDGVADLKWGLYALNGRGRLSDLSGLSHVHPAPTLEMITGAHSSMTSPEMIVAGTLTGSNVMRLSVEVSNHA